MKKLLLFFSFVLALTTSCSNSEDNICDSAQKLPYTELDKLYNSIDSLNKEYSTLSSTRGPQAIKWGRRFLSGTVDACVGVLTAETGPLGALLFSTVASGLYDDYLDYCMKSVSHLPRYASRNVPPVRLSIVLPVENANFVDSIGYYHNILLNEIQSKNLSFVDDNGNIDYNAYYKEVLAAAKKYGISGNCTTNAPQIFKYMNSIIKPLAQIKEGSQETYLSIIFNETYNDFNFDDSKTLQLRDACDKIIYNDLCMNCDHIVEYGIKVNDLIVSSNVESGIKEGLKIANNIAINSSLYWNSK